MWYQCSGSDVMPKGPTGFWFYLSFLSLARIIPVLLFFLESANFSVRNNNVSKNSKSISAHHNEFLGAVVLDIGSGFRGDHGGHYLCVDEAETWADLRKRFIQYWKGKNPQFHAVGILTSSSFFKVIINH